MKKELAALQSSMAVILVADVHAVSAGFLTYIYRGFPVVVVGVVGVVGVVDSAANVSGN